MATYMNGQIKSINGKYGNFLSCSFKLSEIEKHVNEKGYINFTINERKEVGKYGDTHCAILSEWKPKEKAPSSLDSDEDFGDSQNPSKKSNDNIGVEDIPF